MTDSLKVYIEITAVNDTAYFDSSPNLIVKEDSLYTYDILLEDIDSMW